MFHFRPHCLCIRSVLWSRAILLFFGCILTATFASTVGPRDELSSRLGVEPSAIVVPIPGALDAWRVLLSRYLAYFFATESVVFYLKTFWSKFENPKSKPLFPQKESVQNLMLLMWGVFVIGVSKARSGMLSVSCSPSRTGFPSHGFCWWSRD